MQTRNYSILTFPFEGSWVWTVVREGSVIVLQRGAGYKTKKAAYGVGAEWLRKYKEGQVVAYELGH